MEIPKVKKSTSPHARIRARVTKPPDAARVDETGQASTEGNGKRGAQDDPTTSVGPPKKKQNITARALSPSRLSGPSSLITNLNPTGALGLKEVKQLWGLLYEASLPEFIEYNRTMSLLDRAFFGEPSENWANVVKGARVEALSDEAAARASTPWLYRQAHTLPTIWSFGTLQGLSSRIP